MENVHLKDEGKQMEEKDWESSDKCNFCDENSNTSQQKVDNTVPVRTLGHQPFFGIVKICLMLAKRF